MLNFLKKLDSMAERFIDTMDNDLQEPVVRILNGDVFNSGSSTPQQTTPETPVLYLIDSHDDASHAAPASCPPTGAVSDLTRDAVLA